MSIADRLPSPRPSLHDGLARSAGESKYPNLWNGLIGLWVPSAGHQGITTLRDFSGPQRHVTLSGMDSTAWVLGKNGYALDFDGINDFGATPDFTVAWTELTVSAWINVDSFLLDNEIVSRWRTSAVTNDRVFTFRVTSGAILKAFNSDDGSNSSPNRDGATTLSTGVWYHVAYVWKASTNLDLYLNGKLDNSTLTGSINSSFPGESSRPLRIGVMPFDGNSFNGKIDDVRLYKRALTPAEIMQSYLGASPLVPRPRILAKSPAVSSSSSSCRSSSSSSSSSSRSSSSSSSSCRSSSSSSSSSRSSSSSSSSSSSRSSSSSSCRSSSSSSSSLSSSSSSCRSSSSSSSSSNSSSSSSKSSSSSSCSSSSSSSIASSSSSSRSSSSCSSSCSSSSRSSSSSSRSSSSSSSSNSSSSSSRSSSSSSCSSSSCSSSSSSSCRSSSSSSLSSSSSSSSKSSSSSSLSSSSSSSSCRSSSSSSSSNGGSSSSSCSSSCRSSSSSSQGEVGRYGFYLVGMG